MHQLVNLKKLKQNKKLKIDKQNNLKLLLTGEQYPVFYLIRQTMIEPIPILNLLALAH